MSEDAESGLTTSEAIDRRMKYKETQPPVEGEPPKVKVDRQVQRQREVKVRGS